MNSELGRRVEKIKLMRRGFVGEAEKAKESVPKSLVVTHDLAYKNPTL